MAGGSPSPLFYDYNFRFAEDSSEFSYRVDIDPETLESAVPALDPVPEWASFSFRRCESCNCEEGSHCPVALRLAGPMERFRNMRSYHRAIITVTSPQRTYSKETDVQTGLSSLLGLLMATSGCSALSRFKPMAYFHLPFSSPEETAYRFASLLLLESHFQGREAPHLDGPAITEFYRPISELNRCMMNRLTSVVKADSAPNAVVILDTFSSIMSYMFDQGLEELRSLFVQHTSNAKESK